MRSPFNMFVYGVPADDSETNRGETKYVFEATGLNGASFAIMERDEHYIVSLESLSVVFTKADFAELFGRLEKSDGTENAAILQREPGASL